MKTITDATKALEHVFSLQKIEGEDFDLGLQAITFLRDFHSSEPKEQIKLGRSIYKSVRDIINSVLNEKCDMVNGVQLAAVAINKLKTTNQHISSVLGFANKITPELRQQVFFNYIKNGGIEGTIRNAYKFDTDSGTDKNVLLIATLMDEIYEKCGIEFTFKCFHEILFYDGAIDITADEIFRECVLNRNEFSEELEDNGLYNSGEELSRVFTKMYSMLIDKGTFMEHYDKADTDHERKHLALSSLNSNSHQFIRDLVKSKKKIPVEFVLEKDELFFSQGRALSEGRALEDDCKYLFEGKINIEGNYPASLLAHHILHGERLLFEKSSMTQDSLNFLAKAVANKISIALSRSDGKDNLREILTHLKRMSEDLGGDAPSEVASNIAKIDLSRNKYFKDKSSVSDMIVEFFGEHKAVKRLKVDSDYSL